MFTDGVESTRFTRCDWTIIGVQALLIGCSIAASIWIQIPAIGIAGLCVLALCVVACHRSTGLNERLRKWGLTIAWAGTVLSPFALAFNRSFTVDSYYAWVAWMTALAILLTGYRSPDSSFAKSWKILALAWGFLGAIVWITYGYAENLRAAFNFGLLACVVLLVLCRLWFHMGGFGIQVAHTLILLLIGLPILDFFTRPQRTFDKQQLINQKYYQYAAAKRDPAAFAAWWKFYNTEWRLVEDRLFDRVPHFLALRPKPNSRGAFFDSQIEINSRGFRGKEFSLDKNGAYRIVALGESTTFCVTLTRDDKPWPELLEEMIQNRLRPTRRVEVINAGIPTYTLGHSLQRLAADILPLKPDMIISYHGYNGFPMIYRAIPPASGFPPPIYKLRPIKLLGDVEYRFKLRRYKQRLMAGLLREPPGELKPMESEYAHAYEQLIEAARTKGIRLVLANFSMAVNERSQPEVVEFYRVPFPAVHGQIKANAALSIVVRELANRHSEVCFLDTHPHLDGEHDKFVDLIHCAPDGHQQLAENMFAGIRECLLTDLARPAGQRSSDSKAVAEELRK